MPSITPTSFPTEISTPQPTQTNTPQPTATHIATETETPTPGPTVTLTPTVTPSPTPQPTDTPAPTQTPTRIPTITPTPTWTPTPVLIQNPPQLIPNQHPLYEIRRYETESIQIKAFDSNRDAITFTIEPHDYITDHQTTTDAFFTITTFQLRTDLESGEYQILITASDGFYDVKQVLHFRIYEDQPTLTPSPTATATAPPTVTPTASATHTPMPQPTLTPTPTVAPTRTATVAPTHTLSPTKTPQPTATNSPTPTLASTPTETPAPLPGPTLLLIADLRILMEEVGTPLLDLDDYAFDVDAPPQMLTWQARPLSDNLRLSIDAANRLYVEAPRKAGVYKARFTLSDGATSVSQDAVIKISSFRLGDFFRLPPISLSPNESYVTPYSLFDGIEPEDFPTGQMEFSIQQPLDDGIETMRVLENGHIEITAGALPPKGPIAIPIVAALRLAPTVTPTPSITSTPTPTQKPAAPTPTPAIVAQACGREIALSKFFEIEVGAAPYDMAWDDVNHDGRLDYLTANYGESSATLLLSQDEGPFQIQTLPSGEGCLNGLLNDLNDDGENDALLLGGYDSTLTFYPSIDGRFTTSIQWGLPDLIQLPEERLERARIRLIAIGRFFINETKCIAVALPNQIVLYQYANGEFSIKQTLAVPFSATQLAAADLDNDGVDELLVAHADPENMLAYRVTPSGLEPIIEHPLDANFFGNDPQDIITSDLNHDGRPDFTAITFNREVHTLLSPDYLPRIFSGSVPMVVNDLEAGDFDRDGEAELILAGYDVQNQVSSLAILCGDRPTEFTRVIAIPIPQAFPVGQQFNIASTDFNGDGWADAVLLDRINNRLVFFANVTPIQP